MKFIYTPLLYFIIIPLFCNSQTVEPSSTINYKTLQIEIESLYANQKEHNIKQTSWSIPSALFRFGAFKGVEIQLNTPIIKEQLWENDHLIHSLHKFDDVQFGLAINLWPENNILPETSLMIRAILPTNSKFNLEKMGKICALNFSNTISNTLNLQYNLGYALETDNTKSGFYIINLGYEASENWHFFVENFGDFDQKKLISTNLNFGGGYNFNEKMAFDISIANGLNHSMFYIGGILTFIINTKN